MFTDRLLFDSEIVPLKLLHLGISQIRLKVTEINPETLQNFNQDGMDGSNRVAAH